MRSGAAGTVGLYGFGSVRMIESAIAIVGVLVLAWLNKWNERRLSNRIKRSMDQVMGRNDPDYRA